MGDREAGLKVLVLHTHAPKSYVRYEYAGQHIYEVDPDNPTRIAHPCGVAAYASAFRGAFRLWRDVPSFEWLDQYDVILVVPKVEFPNEWLKAVKARFPDKIIVGQFDEPLRYHKLCCRSWRFQKEVYEVSQIVN